MAGFDPSSGAGTTADLQVFAAHGLFGVCAVTAITVQNTLRVLEVAQQDALLLRRVLDHLCADLPPAGIKLGMLGSAEAVVVTGAFLDRVAAANPGEAPIPIVCDPVMRSSSGAELLPARGVELLRSWLLDRVSWVTPNWPELSMLTEREVGTLAQAEAALDALGQRFPKLHAVATGGDRETPIDVLRTPAGKFHRFEGRRIQTTSTHGTGCAFSSALLARLLAGDAAVAAVAGAKAFVEGALRHAPGLGHGRGPMDLLWTMRQIEPPLKEM